MTVELAPMTPAFPARVEPGMQFGPYEVLLCVARGGMATVWAARQHGARGFSRLVALKTVLPELAEPEFEAMFVDEARVAARIHHPNVCEIFELIEHRGVLALSMEWIDGDTLNAVMEGRGAEPVIDVRVAAQIVAQVASGLHAAHSLKDESGTPMQLVHRDVSPQNILISRTGHVKVTDFGIAKALGGSREATAAGQVKGKLSYMSPEQADGRLVDRRSDIFSLGVVLYQTTVGVHPFRRANESRQQLLFRLLLDPIQEPSKVVPGYPAELEAIVMRALDRNPAERFATADEMRCQLQDWLVRTGPLVTEHHIAEVVAERAGLSIQKRAERVQRSMQATRHQRDTKTGVVRRAKPERRPSTRARVSKAPDGLPTATAVAKTPDGPAAAAAPVAQATYSSAPATPVAQATYRFEPAAPVARATSALPTPGRLATVPDVSHGSPSPRTQGIQLPEVTFVPTSGPGPAATPRTLVLRARTRKFLMVLGAAGLGVLGVFSLLTAPSGSNVEPLVAPHAAAAPAAMPRPALAIPVPQPVSRDAPSLPRDDKRKASVPAADAPQPARVSKPSNNKPRTKSSAGAARPVVIATPQNKAVVVPESSPSRTPSPREAVRRIGPLEDDL